MLEVEAQDGLQIGQEGLSQIGALTMFSKVRKYLALTSDMALPVTHMALDHL